MQPCISNGLFNLYPLVLTSLPTALRGKVNCSPSSRGTRVCPLLEALMQNSYRSSGLCWQPQLLTLRTSQTQDNPINGLTPHPPVRTRRQRTRAEYSGRKRLCELVSLPAFSFPPRGHTGVCFNACFMRDLFQSPSEMPCWSLTLSPRQSAPSLMTRAWTTTGKTEEGECPWGSNHGLALVRTEPV